MFFSKTEPDITEINNEQRRPSNNEAMSQQHRKGVSNRGLTGASALTVKQSIFPIALVTVLFFLWGFAYGLLDVLNAKFQNCKCQRFVSFVYIMSRIEAPPADIESIKENRR